VERKASRLCKLASRGDTKAAEELVETYHARVFSYLARLCGGIEDAEDLTQLTFSKAWLSLSTYKARSKFSTWLFRIAYNVYVDWLRGRKETLSFHSGWWEDHVDPGPSPRQTTAEKEMGQHLLRAVEGLDEEKRHTVHLHYFADLSIRDTARVLGVSTSTVKYS
jgi:RNA polymerase sigma-70 factor, ECF subfamily